MPVFAARGLPHGPSQPGAADAEKQSFARKQTQANHRTGQAKAGVSLEVCRRPGGHQNGGEQPGSEARPRGAGNHRGESRQ